ncbi:MAG: beta-N-acetylhexosaminidase [Candidatus Sumerlaeaceae bacterium]|nr:beta-N-acetylhexosaminidase [Candidatus Sumerlaeaceae bacterium]
MAISLADPAMAAKTAPLAIQRNGIRCEVTRPEDLVLLVDGIPFLSAPELYIVSKNWTRKFYAFADDSVCTRARRVEETSTTSRVVFPLKSPGGEFTGELIYEVSDEKMFRVSLRGEITTPSEARVEHRFGRCAAGWFMGREWQATLEDGSTTRGIAPIVAKSAVLSEATIVERIRSLDVTSPVYTVRVRTSGNYRFALVDYRLSPYNAGELCYWLGILESPIVANRPFEYAAEVCFSSREMKMSVTVVSTTQPVVLCNDVLAPQEAPKMILPTPKHIQWADGHFKMPAILPVTIKGAKKTTITSTRQLFDAIVGRQISGYGVVTQWKTSAEQSPSLLTIEYSERARRRERQGCYDYHRLTVSPQGVHVEVATTGGLRAALASLVQLLRYGADKPWIACCTIDDYSALPIRAVHFFSGKEGSPLQLTMLRDILLPLKFNMLIFQCEYIKWDSFPQIHHSRYGMDKAEAQAVIDEAKRLGFEVVPLINTFGHCEWLLDNDSFRELSDNPDNPYAYDPSNPRVYEVCTKIYEEALAMFQPRYFHIGHDEVTLQGFPEKEQNKKRGAELLFYEDTLFYYRWLRERGLKMMMWGDQLLAPGEGAGATMAASKEQAQWLRNKLPKDIIIADWHYDPDPPEHFINLRILSESGFDVLACTWYSPLNILRFAKAATEEHQRQRAKQRDHRQGRVLGLMQTTWAGYSFDQQSFENSFDQYAAYVLAGEAAWRGGGRELTEVPYDFRKEFARLWTEDLLPPSGGGGWLAVLDGAANLKLGDSQECVLIGGEGRASAFQNLVCGVQRLERWQVRLAQCGQVAAACLFDAQFNPPGPWLKQLRVPVERGARAIFFVVASTVPGPATAPIALTTIEFDDNTTEAIEWRPGANVFGLEDNRSLPRAPLVWANGEKGKAPTYLHGYIWINPVPSKKIREVRFETTNRGGALLLLGMSGLE